ncbi:hypothetical protein SAMN05216334_104109 [Nitrosomonas ureae]|uniref:Uncharacterized protein n=1 Tax=Nitrosomonas ureae TaxID=44577 RepID=A0A1H5TCE5_9PROT|nr:hypothetical protein SAMN05216334_104109 [Nitrosomonas ureae]
MTEKTKKTGLFVISTIYAAVLCQFAYCLNLAIDMVPTAIGVYPYNQYSGRIVHRLEFSTETAAMVGVRVECVANQIKQWNAVDCFEIDRYNFHDFFLFCNAQAPVPHTNNMADL